MMKPVFFLCLVISTCSMAQQKVLFLAAGQSNAVGQGDRTASIACKEGTAYEYRYTQDSLLALQDPVGYNELHFEKANTGSAWPAFADSYHSLTGKIVVMVQAARGGSSCHVKAEMSDYGTWYNTGRLPLFDSAIIKTKAAMHKTGLALQGILWSQGERDANAMNTGGLTPAEYEASLTELIAKFRKELGEQVRFYIIQTGYYLHHSATGFDAVRAIQEKVCRQLKGVYLVYHQTGEFEQKGWMKDEIHYQQTALNDIGKEVARQVVLKEKESL